METVSDEYDAFGNLIKETVTPYTGGVAGTAVVTKFAVDGWNPAKAGATGQAGFDTWAVMNGSGNLQTRNIQGNGLDQILARVDTSYGLSDSPGLYLTLTDRQGSVRAVLDSTPDAAPADLINYDAFGNIISTGTGAETNPAYRGMYAWDGYDYNTATSLYVDHARFYDPQSQRWMSQDPLGFDAGDSNLYRYVNNAPTNATDPSGNYLFAFTPHIDRLINAFSKAKIFAEFYQVGQHAFGPVPINAILLRKLPGYDKAFASWTDENKGITNMDLFTAAASSTTSNFMSGESDTLSTAIERGRPLKLPPGSPSMQEIKNMVQKADEGYFIASTNQLAIFSPYGTANSKVVHAVQQLGGTVCRPVSHPASINTKQNWRGPANISQLASVIKDASMDGRRKFTMITIEGHCGADAGLLSPGICLQKPSGEKGQDNPSGWRLDLTNLKADGKGVKNAIQGALLPGGYVRLVGCGYKEKFNKAEKSADAWQTNVQDIAQYLGVPVLVAPTQMAIAPAPGKDFDYKYGYFEKVTPPQTGPIDWGIGMPK